MRLRGELKLTYLFISHNLPQRGELLRPTSVAIMYLGRVVELAPTATVFERANHPYVLQALCRKNCPRSRPSAVSTSPSAANCPRRSPAPPTVARLPPVRCPHAVAPQAARRRRPLLRNHRRVARQAPAILNDKG